MTSPDLTAATVRPAGATLGWMPVYEKQRQIMNYLKQVDAARAQVAIEKGQGPSSIHELVGIDRYIKTIRPVGGEDYSGLSMEKGKPLTVTTEDGMTVTYDPSGATTTPIDMPPEVTRAELLFAQAQKLAQKLGPARQRAVEAYRLANHGKQPVTKCTVYIPGRRSNAFKSLPGGMAREISLELFGDDPNAPDLGNEVRLVCAQGSITMPAE